MENMENIEKAVAVLRQGEPVVFPTETVYGLGADARNSEAIAKIFALKQRPHFNPLIVHVASMTAAEELIHMTPDTQKLATHFWPGSLTLIGTKKDTTITPLVSAGLETLAIRIPAHKTAQALLQKSAMPLAAPSANLSGRLSPTEAKHIDIKNIMILDGGKTEKGLESTIISCQHETPLLLRQGAIASEEIETVLGKKLQQAKAEYGKEARLSPGRTSLHYSPQAKLRINATHIEKDEALLTFGNTPDHKGLTLNLSKNGNLQEAAANFFSFLHELDKKAEKIAVHPIPEKGLGRAINDRLERAVQSNDGTK